MTEDRILTVEDYEQGSYMRADPTVHIEKRAADAVNKIISMITEERFMIEGDLNFYLGRLGLLGQEDYERLRQIIREKKALDRSKVKDEPFSNKLFDNFKANQKFHHQTIVDLLIARFGLDWGVEPTSDDHG